MSHVTKIVLHVRDLDCLDSGGRTIGLELMRGQTEHKWYGTFMGDYPLADGVKQEDLGKCDHALKVKGRPFAYEVGVKKRADGDGYDLLWDFYNGGFGLEETIGKDGYKLKQAYAEAVAMKQLYSEGYQVSRSVTSDGRIVLEASK